MNPYLLPEGNVQLAFSGGRSSGYMLHQILEANGSIPGRAIVTFQNAGREMAETLDFVHEVGNRWGVKIEWLEYLPDSPGFIVVDHAALLGMASRSRHSLGSGSSCQTCALASAQGRTKSGKWREVPLNRYARWALRHLPDPLVAVHKDTVSDWFASDAKRAGIGGSLHRLRHTFCAHMVMAGVPLRRVQILAGHADYATTEKYYAHLTPEGDDGAVAKLRY